MTDSKSSAENKVFWSSPGFEGSSKMADFARAQGKSSWEDLYHWSIEGEAFWEAFLRYSPIVYTGGFKEAFRPSAQGTFYGGRWFHGLRLNYAENLISGMIENPLYVHTEKESRLYHKDEIVDAVRKLQFFLKDKGVGKGDVVAGFLPNQAEAILCMLATSSLGAVWSSCSPEFGVQGVLDRLRQVSPKVLFLCSEYHYNGKSFSMTEKNEALLKELNSVVASLTVGKADFESILSSDRSHELEFTRLDFLDPLYVLFSSGTTGVPKCIVHSVGGTLIQHYKELLLHADLKAGENFSYYTTTGWMMWNWMVSALGVGACVHTYDGAAIRRDGWTLWDFVQSNAISSFGTSAKFVGACRTEAIKAFDKTSALRQILSTGSPLLPEDFDYIYSHETAERVQLASICGGTDIVSCFMLGNPLKNVRRGEIQSPGLGMAIASYSSDGRPRVAEQGELVCEKPFPSMPVYFMNDDNNERYEKAYFRKYPGVWHHGDFVTITEGGGVVVHGRSDATLNPGGVRIGTAEIYRQVESIEGVADSLVVGRRVPGDEEIVLFLRLKDGHNFDEAFARKLKEKIKNEASPRHVPRHVFEVTDIPYTRSGKKVEIAVKGLIHGEEPKNVEALANPECLVQYRNIRFEQ